MIKKEIGYSYNDLTLVPSIISGVKSRSEISVLDKNDRLPIFVSPMASVINDKNYKKFESNKLYTVIPRSVDLKARINLFNADGNLFSNMNFRFIAMSLDEFKKYFCTKEEVKKYKHKKYNVCIDIANGHMEDLYDTCLKGKKMAAENEYELIIMTGNIANPETYEYIIQNSINNKIRIVDYIRCAIGSGSGCITSSNTGIHMPIATLIDECNNIKNKYKNDLYYDDPSEDGLFEPIELNDIIPYIVADGGIRNYSDVIKALALGADYVMIGSLFAKTLESCGEKMFINYKGEKEMCSADDAYELYQKGAQLYTKFYGMASADGQIAISGKKTKTAEGIVKMLPVEYKLYKWVENMDSYLRSAMSYCDCKKLDEFIGKQTLIVNSIGEQGAVNK